MRSIRTSTRIMHFLTHRWCRDPARLGISLNFCVSRSRRRPDAKLTVSTKSRIVIRYCIVNLLTILHMQTPAITFPLTTCMRGALSRTVKVSIFCITRLMKIEEIVNCNI
jgi:hypothetical protein